MGVVNAFAQDGTKTPILLVDKNGELATSDFDIVPIAPSTLDKTNLYSATFTPKADFKNAFQYLNMEVGDYDKIVIKFAEAVADGWNVNEYGGFKSLKGLTEYVVNLNGTPIEDFTIFNWEGCRAPITISECYFFKSADPLATQKSELSAAIARGKLYNSVAYTDATFTTLTTKIADGETALTAEGATEESLTGATSGINNAIAALELKEGYTNLTADMYKRWNDNINPTEGTAVNCAYELFKSVGQPYGDGSVQYLNFADISEYSKLILAVADGTPRIMMNREVPLPEGTEGRDANGGAYVQITDTPVDGLVTVDLTQYDYAHLNAIKGANWANVTITGMYLYKAPAASEDILPIDIQFGEDYNSQKVNNYTTTWTATKDGKTWTLTNFNNNQNNWNSVKCGSKKNTSIASIASPAIEAVVKSYVISAANVAFVNSAKLTIMNGETKVGEDIDITEKFAAGEIVVPVDGQKGYSYVLTIDNAQATNDKNGNVEITKITLSGETIEPVEPVHIENTAETAYTVAEAIALIEAGEALSETVFVKGIVSKVDEYNDQYKNITYWISADGTTEGAQFECFRGKGIDGAEFTSIDDIKVGATVIVKGTMKKYVKEGQDDIYEFNQNNELVSYVAPAPAPVVLEKVAKKAEMTGELKSIAELEANKFMLQNEAGLVIYTPDGWDVKVADIITATSNTGNGGLLEVKPLDGDHAGQYQIPIYNLDGTRRKYWAGEQYLNSQPVGGNVIFGLDGTAPKYGQDGQDLALWTIAYEAEKGFAFHCVGRDVYLGNDAEAARPVDAITYWKAYTGYIAGYDEAEILAAYELAVANVKATETATALTDAKTAYDTDKDLTKFGDAVNAAIDAIKTCQALNEAYANLDKTGAVVAAEVLAKYNNGEYANIAELRAAYILAAKAQTTPGANMTLAIVNPSFEFGNINGWTSTNGGNSANNGNFGAATGSFFVERWTAAPGKLSDGSFTQVISGLPAGKYKLTAEMQNLEQGNNSAAGKGYYLIANTDSTEVTVSGSTVAVVTTLAEGADLTIGTALKDCTGNWVCVDNFQLTFNADADELVAPEGWTNMIANGNLAGDDVTNFIAKEAPSTEMVGATIDAKGKDNSRGIVVKSRDEEANADAWNTQFFIKMNEPLEEGTKLHVEFDYMASQDAKATTQAHGIPGAYLHWAGIGDVNFTTEWKHFSTDITVSAAQAKGNDGNGNGTGMQTIAFNLAEVKTATEYYFDNFGVWAQKPAPVEDWVDIVVNGNMEGDDASCFYVSEQGVGGPYVAKFTENIGKDGSKAIKIQSADKPANAWDTQFFVRLPYQLPAGTKYKISFDIKADAAAKSSTQIHGEPGGWKGNAFGDVNFTTEWQSFEKEGNVAADMQTFVFNLAELATANVYVFDNVKVLISEAVKNTLTLNPATNPVAYPSEAVLAAREDLKAAIAEAEAIDTTDKLGVEELTAAITEAKKHTSANTLEEIETAKADLATAIAAFNEANKPVVTHTWDFTKWSEATVANLKADAAASKVAGWSDVEKKADAEAGADPTEASKDNCFWAVIPEGGELTANGVAIEELKGLQFGATFAGNRSLAIAVNYAVADASKDFGPYNGPAYLWLGGAGFECFTIPAVKGGTKITMGVESHKITDARGVQLFAGETELKDAEGNAVAAPTTYTEQTWAVPAGVAYDIVVKNTKGCHIYFIDAEQDEATLTSISTVKSNVMNNAIYNLNGQKVNKAHKGLFIINGKKVVK